MLKEFYSKLWIDTNNVLAVREEYFEGKLFAAVYLKEPVDGAYRISIDLHDYGSLSRFMKHIV